MKESNIELWTLGHSTRESEELFKALRSFEIKLLVDVRSFPGSRRYPQFNKEKLKTSLTAGGIEYQHFPELSRRRGARSDSHNVASRHKKVRGFADYMETGKLHAWVV